MSIFLTWPNLLPRVTNLAGDFGSWGPWGPWGRVPKFGGGHKWPFVTNGKTLVIQSFFAQMRSYSAQMMSPGLNFWNMVKNSGKSHMGGPPKVFWPALFRIGVYSWTQLSRVLSSTKPSHYMRGERRGKEGRKCPRSSNENRFGTTVILSSLYSLLLLH